MSNATSERTHSEINVVFGATGGIGSALCRLLAARGSQLYVAARNPERVERLGRELGAEWRALDATNAAEVEGLVEDAAAKCGGVTGVVNCVGSLLLQPAHRTSEEEWHATLSLNLGTAFNTVRAAARCMRSQGGSVVLVSSAAALTGLPNHEAIAAAKAGIVGLTRSAAATYASSQLRFNAVAPGLTRTEMTRRLWKSERLAAGSAAMHPLGRLGTPEDVASLIAWLLEPNNSWVTGQVINVDGGLGHVRVRQKS